MKWGEFKNSIRNLGFEDYGVFDENPSHIAEACNRANILLHNLVEPNLKSKKYELDGDKEYNCFDLSEIPDYVGSTLKAPLADGNPVADFYYVEDEIYINGSGEVTIFYNGALAKISEGASDDTELECKDNLIPFLELLTAYYIWLDDDERKAVMYYNQFHEMLNSFRASGYSGSAGGITDEARQKVEIVGGVIL